MNFCNECVWPLEAKRTNFKFADSGDSCPEFGCDQEQCIRMMHIAYKSLLSDYNKLKEEKQN